MYSSIAVRGKGCCACKKLLTSNYLRGIVFPSVLSFFNPDPRKVITIRRKTMNQKPHLLDRVEMRNDLSHAAQSCRLLLRLKNDFALRFLPPLEVTEEDAARLRGALELLLHARISVSESLGPIDFALGEICTCKMTVLRFEEVGISTVSAFLTASTRELFFILHELEKSGAERQRHLYALALQARTPAARGNHHATTSRRSSW